MATIKAITLSDADGAQKYPRTYTKLVQNGDGEILDNIMLTSAKILPFRGYEVGLNDAAPEAVAPSGYTINYHSSRNMFFAVVDNVNYSNWGDGEQLLYNRGYSAREDNVYIHSNGNICVIKNGSMTTISTVGAYEEGALSANKFLPFSSINADLDVTLQMASITRSGEPILYIQEHNVFAVERVVQGITKYYPSWGTSADMTESLKYNNGNGTVGYNAREDNVYIAATNDMYVIIDGSVILVTNIGTMLNIACSSLEYEIAGVKANIDDLLLRVAALEAKLT